MTDISLWGHVLAGVGAVAAGTVNAVAGGGTLITFPLLTAIGVPAVRANATNTISLCPGYVAGTYAQRADLEGLRASVRTQAFTAAVGGLSGSVLLVLSSESAFKVLVPFLVLLATVLLAMQDRMRRWVAARGSHESHATVALVAIFLASVYGGYFGAGLGIMLVAVLGVFSDLPFTRLNAVKQLLSFLVNVSAAVFLSFSGKAEWSLVAVMAPAAIMGGTMGGRLARVLPAQKLRSGVIVLGLVVSVIYFLRL
ncbi:MAG: putative rane protein [Ilumatobacteraceae bacterium]|nr:putative rane protein [Ilumatobacteraceae bacterium]